MLSPTLMSLMLRYGESELVHLYCTYTESERKQPKTKDKV